MSHPRVGVGVIVHNGSQVLLGRRIGTHGAETWCFPGGHLEFGETPFQCAERELLEETGLTSASLSVGPYTNDFFEAEGKHYITLFILAAYERGAAQVLEPDKCREWQWFEWAQLPHPLFLPIQNLVKLGFVIPAT